MLGVFRNISLTNYIIYINSNISRYNKIEFNIIEIFFLYINIKKLFH